MARHVGRGSSLLAFSPMTTRPLRASLSVSHGRLLSRRLIRYKTTTRRVKASSSPPDYQFEARKTGRGLSIAVSYGPLLYAVKIVPGSTLPGPWSDGINRKRAELQEGTQVHRLMSASMC